MPVTCEYTDMDMKNLEEADALTDIILLCRGKRENGNPFWAYLSIKPSKAKAFKEAQMRGNFFLEDHGTILLWGEGDDVPDDIKKEMEQRYKMDNNQE